MSAPLEGRVVAAKIEMRDSLVGMCDLEEEAHHGLKHLFHLRTESELCTSILLRIGEHRKVFMS